MRIFFNSSTTSFVFFIQHEFIMEHIIEHVRNKASKLGCQWSSIYIGYLQGFGEYEIFQNSF